MKVLWILLLVLALASSSVWGATLTGTIYNQNLQPEADVLLEVNTQPIQKFLAKEGKYSFVLPPGKYTLTAEKGEVLITEPITVIGEGTFVFDLFLLPDLTEEAELLNETQDNLIVDIEDPPRTWAYVVAGIITLILLWRVVRARKKYGPLPSIWRWGKKPASEKKKEAVPAEISTIEDALDILKKHDGRMNQKDLRKEMMHLSEAKVSLIVTELEHLGKVEKIKKGRGNVLILKR